MLICYINTSEKKNVYITLNRLQYIFKANILLETNEVNLVFIINKINLFFEYKSRQNHPFYSKHNDLLKAIWSIDRSSKNSSEKLSKLKEAIKTNPPSNLVDIYDEKTGESRAKVPPLIIACFEGDYDTIQFLLNVIFKKRIYLLIKIFC